MRGVLPASARGEGRGGWGAEHGVALARACLADQQCACIATARHAVGGRWDAECVSQDKRQLCQIKCDVCDEQTAGIGGTLGQQCVDIQKRWLAEAKQDHASVATCRSDCESRLATERAVG